MSLVMNGCDPPEIRARQVADYLGYTRAVRAEYGCEQPGDRVPLEDLYQEVLHEFRMEGRISRLWERLRMCCRTVLAEGGLR